MKSIIIILNLVTVAVLAIGCNSGYYAPLPKALDDSDYKKPSKLAALDQVPDHVKSPIDKQVKFVTPDGNNQSKRRKNKGGSEASKNVDKVATVEDVTIEDNVTQSVAAVATKEPQYSEDDMDPSSNQAAIVSRNKDNEHPSRTSFNPFVGNELVVDLNSEKFCYPIDGKYSSGYGSRGRGWHSGVDLTAAQGTPIYAAFDGVVRMSKPYGGYGNMIVLQHGNGLETVYGHCQRNLVGEGERVKAGQKIATCGRTGRASGYHLHFEVRIVGQTINPALLMNYSLKRLQPGTLIITKNGSRIAATRKTGDSSIENDNKPIVPQKDEVVKDNTAQLASASTANGGNKSEEAVVHTIVKGDTLYALSRKYATTVDAICKLNGISKTIILKLGAKLKVK